MPPIPLAPPLARLFCFFVVIFALPSTNALYSPFETLVRSGPISFITRVTQPTEYTTQVEEYLTSNKGCTTRSAQGNVDAYTSNYDLWLAQKEAEKLGKVDVYDYGKELEPEKLALSLAWAGIVGTTGARVFWQLYHGNSNLW